MPCKIKSEENEIKNASVSDTSSTTLGDSSTLN